MDAGGSSNGSCYYSVLGIRKDATASDIRAAYRKLALRWHPDRWAKNPAAAGEAKAQFQKVQRAYAVLSNEGKRALYNVGWLELAEELEAEEQLPEGLEGMGSMCDFLQELLGVMDQDAKAGKKQGFESLEELRRSFQETFGTDLMKAEEQERVEQQSARKKRACAAGPSSRPAPNKRSSSAGGSA